MNIFDGRLKPGGGEKKSILIVFCCHSPWAGHWSCHPKVAQNSSLLTRPCFFSPLPKKYKPIDFIRYVSYFNNIIWLIWSRILFGQWICYKMESNSPLPELSFLNLYFVNNLKFCTPIIFPLLRKVNEEIERGREK